MKILIEHPIFNPYEQQIRGGTELFVHRLKEAFPEAAVFASADSTRPCIRSSAYSRLAKKGDLRLPLWYRELGELSKQYDVVLLNSPFISETLMRPHDWYSKVIYFNHNASAWFVTGLGGGIKLIHNLKLLRLMGGRSFCFSEGNWNSLSEVWNNEVRGARVRRYHDRAGSKDHWPLHLFDGIFDQAIFPHDAVPVREPQGYLVAVGRNDPDKRLKWAETKAKELGRELFVLTGMPHDEVMEVVAGADCLLLPSRKETFSIAAFEAMCQGVPVSYIEAPPALCRYPSLGRKWGDVTTTTLNEREEASRFLSTTYSLSAFRDRLIGLMPS